jgi:enoyl-CoA hydratase
VPADLVTTRRHAATVVITLNRPEKLNAAGLAMQRQLLDTLESSLSDPSLRAAVLTGAGRAFCAGGDLASVSEIKAGNDTLGDALGRVNQKLLDLLLTRELPVLAAVNGPAIGFGAALLALCDIVVMAASAFISEPHARYGLRPSPACALLWPRLMSHSVARELLLTGRRVGADEAVRLGLANRVVADGDELACALHLAEELAGSPREGIAAVLRELNTPLLAAAPPDQVWTSAPADVPPDARSAGESLPR